jgi:hypothetical protein
VTAIARAPAAFDGRRCCSSEGRGRVDGMASSSTEVGMTATP